MSFALIVLGFDSNVMHLFKFCNWATASSHLVMCWSRSKIWNAYSRLIHLVNECTRFGVGQGVFHWHIIKSGFTFTSFFPLDKWFIMLNFKVPAIYTGFGLGQVEYFISILNAVSGRQRNHLYSRLCLLQFESFKEGCHIIELTLLSLWTGLTGHKRNL